MKSPEEVVTIDETAGSSCEQLEKLIASSYMSAPVGLCLLDTGLRYVHINERLAGMNGKPVSAHIGRGINEVIPEIAPKLEPVLRQVLETGEPLLDVDMSDAMPAAAARLQHWVANFSPLRSSDGSVAGISVVVQEVTGRKQAEQEIRKLNSELEQRVGERTKELRAGEARLKHLLTGGPAVIYSCSPWGDYGATFVSENVELLTGYEAREFVGRSAFWAEHIHPEDRTRVFACLYNLFEHGQHAVEYRFKHKNGSYHWVHDERTLVRDATGKALEIVGYWADITERNKVEERLRESEARFRTLFERAAIGITLVSMNGRVIESNQAFQRMLGYSEEELQGMVITEFTHADDAERDVKFLRDAAAGGRETYQREKRYRRKNGGLIWANLTASLVRNTANEPAFLIGMVEDISERKRIEEEVRRLALFPEQCTDPVFELGPGGEITYLNPATRSRFPELQWAPADHPLLEGLGDAIDELRQGDGATLAREVQVGNSVCQERVAYDRPSGLTRVYVLDITRQKEAEKQLAEARDKALQAVRLKSEFVANVSHEIQTPMSVIMVMTELTLDSGLTPEQRRYLNPIDRSAQSLLGIINDILDCSKIEAGKLTIEPVEFQVAEVLDETTKALAIHAQEKGLALTCNIQPEVPVTLVGDPGRLRQIIVNLVSNAIKFTEHGQIAVNAVLEPRAEGHACLRFSVSDTGIGIPPEKQSLVFESFSQADGTITRRYGGTGLGLSICKQLVELMGGRIWVEGEEGKGSTFYFTLRFEGADRAPDQLPRAKTVGKARHPDSAPAGAHACPANPAG